uniref:signal transducer CD24 isoform X1 n=1 Tax=Podarcis muralis TaxID=64176 RepID=UPI00109F907E|nr:signal transducer CD24 isoform X1 [Podarcis muralis]
MRLPSRSKLIPLVEFVYIKSGLFSARIHQNSWPLRWTPSSYYKRTREGFMMLVFLQKLMLMDLTSGGNGTTPSAANNNSSPTSAPLSTLNNTTTKGHGSSLQSTTGLFILTISLLYVC